MVLLTHGTYLPFQCGKDFWPCNQSLSLLLVYKEDRALCVTWKRLFHVTFILRTMTAEVNIPFISLTKNTVDIF